MARSRRRDRVVAVASPGGSKLYDPNGTLPRSTYRDIEALSGTFAPDSAVYQYRQNRFSSSNRYYFSSTVVRPRLLPAKQRRQALDRVLLRGVSWLPEVHLPARVRFCVQRKQRREVLFALKRAGFRGSAPKKRYRRNASSNYRC